LGCRISLQARPLRHAPSVALVRAPTYGGPIMEDDLRRDITDAWQKHEQPRRYRLKRAWSGAAVPVAQAVWRHVVAAGPLWGAITAVATAILAYKALRS